jgi:pyruvate dehydrogenase E2 component (dihydrolipoamide acetyltransferase)
MIDFRMPSLGADMEAATLVEWTKQPGERVARGEVIAVVETQKGAIEIESFHAGIIDQVLVHPGQRAAVGQVLALLRDERETVSATTPQPQEAPALVPPAPPRTPIAGSDARDATRVKVTPAARRLAQAEGVDLASLAPGPDGTIGLAEIEHARTALSTPKGDRPAAQDKRGIDVAEMRKAIAAAMARSHREIPQYSVSSTIDVSAMLAWLEGANTARPVPQRLLYAVPLLKAVALALRATPELNGHFADERFTPSISAHIGVAVALRGGGLIAPAIHDVEHLGLDALMVKLDDLVTRVRGGRLRSSELSDATITFSNLGDNSADTITPLIYPPQVAVIGCGRIARRPWAVGDGVAVRPLMTVCVAGDHRVSDGRSAAKFLARLEQLLQQPEAL